MQSKLISGIAIPTLITYLLILGGTLVYLQRVSLDELKQNMTKLVSNHAGRFDGFLREAAAVADTSAHLFRQHQHLSSDEFFAMLRQNIDDRPFIFGACVAFEPGTYRPAGELYAPYVYRDGTDFNEMVISRDVYDWYSDPQWTWFQAPKAQGKPVWSEPYFDKGAGNVLMTTYSTPFQNEKGFQGVATIDIDLTHLHETIGTGVMEGQEFVIVDSNGRFVFDKHQEHILNRNIRDIAHGLAPLELDRLVEKLLSGKPGITTVNGWDEVEQKQWLFHAPIASTSWTLVARTPERDALAGVHRRMTIAAAALGGTLLLIVGCIAFMARRITRPLSTLTNKVGEIAAGHLDVRVEGIKSQDEIGVLASSFNTMAARLREHIERLATEEANRRKIEHDLSIARKIQQGLLPEGQPNLPGYDLAGWSQPADETGGDYYDWQMLPNDCTAISLADVTGHGIGPALVTAVCRAYARASFPTESDAGRALDRINQLLCEDLNAERFVTFVVALIDPASHKLHLLSAGHGPLFYYEAATAKVHQYNAHDIPMGLSPDIVHGPPSDFTMAPGDILVLITDGFLEWANSTGEQYGNDRLAEVIRHSHGLPSAQLIARFVEDVLRFSEGTKQLDDLTAVVLKRKSG